MRTDRPHVGQKLFSALVYPVLVLSMVFTIVMAFRQQHDFGMCNLIFLMWTIAYLAMMEMLVPYDARWQPSLKEWGRDGIYLIITMFGGGMAVALVNGISHIVSPKQSLLPFWLELPIALFLSSLGSYVFHRVTHMQPWLWRVHGIHHVEQKVNVGNNGVNHMLDVLGRRLLALTPLMLLGFSEGALFVIGMFNTMQGYFVHANIRVHLGWLNYLVVTPEQHRLHHSDNLSEAGHYSTDIALWDILLGTFTWRPGREPRHIGVVNPEKFPLPDEIVASLLNPWRKHVPKKSNRVIT